MSPPRAKLGSRSCEGHFIHLLCKLSTQVGVRRAKIGSLVGQGGLATWLSSHRGSLGPSARRFGQHGRVASHTPSNFTSLGGQAYDFPTSLAWVMPYVSLQLPFWKLSQPKPLVVGLTCTSGQLDLTLASLTSGGVLVLGGLGPRGGLASGPTQ